MDIPKDLKYTREHEWVLVEEEAATVGITDYAQSELGDIVFVELPAVGEGVSSGDSAGTIEAVKTVADLFCPVAGEIVEVNTALEDDPECVNRDPYGEGWIFKIAVTDEADLEVLLDASEYTQVVKDQSSQ